MKNSLKKITNYFIKLKNLYHFFLITSVILLIMFVVRDTHRIPKIDWQREENLVIFVAGQSNAANHVNKKYKPKNKFYTFFRNKFYITKDPIRGCSGSGGNIWTIICDKLIENYRVKNVLLINISQGGSKINDWVYDGPNQKILANHLDSLKIKKIPIDFFIWWQGESDNYEYTTYNSYKNDMYKLINLLDNYNIKKILTSSSTFHPKRGINQNLRMAQQETVAYFDKCFSFIDSDSFLEDYRYDNLHFSYTGAQRIAKQIETRILELLVN